MSVDLRVKCLCQFVLHLWSTHLSPFLNSLSLTRSRNSLTDLCASLPSSSSPLQLAEFSSRSSSSSIHHHRFLSFIFHSSYILPRLFHPLSSIFPFTPRRLRVLTFVFIVDLPTLSTFLTSRASGHNLFPPRATSTLLVLSRSAKHTARPSLVHFRFNLAFRAPKNITHNRLYLLSTTKKLNPIIAAQYLTATTTKAITPTFFVCPSLRFPHSRSVTDRPLCTFNHLPSTASSAPASHRLLLNCHSWLNLLVRWILIPCLPSGSSSTTNPETRQTPVSSNLVSFRSFPFALRLLQLLLQTTIRLRYSTTFLIS